MIKTTSNEENEGDFYFCPEECISCCLCVEMAPSMFALDDESLTFIKKQPENAKELSLMIKAITHCPVVPINYRGNDEQILVRVNQAKIT